MFITINLIRFGDPAGWLSTGPCLSLHLDVGILSLWNSNHLHSASFPYSSLLILAQAEVRRACCPLLLSLLLSWFWPNLRSDDLVEAPSTMSPPLPLSSLPPTSLDLSLALSFCPVIGCCCWFLVGVVIRFGLVWWLDVVCWFWVGLVIEFGLIGRWHWIWVCSILDLCGLSDCGAICDLFRFLLDLAIWLGYRLAFIIGCDGTCTQKWICSTSAK